MQKKATNFFFWTRRWRNSQRRSAFTHLHGTPVLTESHSRLILIPRKHRKLPNRSSSSTHSTPRHDGKVPRAVLLPCKFLRPICSVPPNLKGPWRRFLHLLKRVRLGFQFQLIFRPSTHQNASKSCVRLSTSTPNAARSPTFAYSSFRNPLRNPYDKLRSGCKLSRSVTLYSEDQLS